MTRKTTKKATPNLPARRAKKTAPLVGTLHNERALVPQADELAVKMVLERKAAIARYEVLDAEIQAIEALAQVSIATCKAERTQAQSIISMVDAMLVVHDEVRNPATLKVVPITGEGEVS